MPENKRFYFGLGTLIYFMFLVICIFLDYQDIWSYYLLWLHFGRNFIAFYWPKAPDSYLFKLNFPFDTHIETWVPLVPVIVTIVYLVGIGQYIKPGISIHKHRIHHYHFGVLISVIGILLMFLTTETATILLNGKETNLTEIYQGMGLSLLIGGGAFIVADLNDLKNRSFNRQKISQKQ